MESWYLLYCKRGQVLRAKEHLERQEVACFTPIASVEKVSQGKRITVTEPLFPNYMFISFNPEFIHTTTIQSTRGVSHFIRFGALPAIIPQDLIDKLLQADIGHIIEPGTPGQGDQVEIIEGALAGIRAIFAEPDGETRSILLLSVLNKEVRQSVNNKDFRKI